MIIPRLLKPQSSAVCLPKFSGVGPRWRARLPQAWQETIVKVSWVATTRVPIPEAMTGSREGVTRVDDESDVSGRRRALMLAAAVASGLAQRHAGDQALLDLCMNKLLKPGWAGSLDAVERDYVRRAKAALGIHVNVPPAGHRFGSNMRPAHRVGPTETRLGPGRRGPSARGKTDWMGISMNRPSPSR